MRIVYAEPNSKIYVGHQLDNEVTKVRFDTHPIYNLFGENGTFSLYIKRYGEAEGYTVGAPLVAVVGDYVEWTVSSADVAIAGDNECQLRYALSGAVAMSLKWTYTVDESISLGATVPQPMEEWADALQEIVSQITTMPEDLVQVPLVLSVYRLLGISNGDVVQTLPEDIPYINSRSGLEAETFQDAIDELSLNADTLQTLVTNNNTIAQTSFTGNGITFNVAKRNGIVTLTANAGTLTTALPANGTIATIPDGYRPAVGLQVFEYSNSRRVGIGTGGVVLIVSEIESGAQIRFTVTYVCGD